LVRIIATNKLIVQYYTVKILHFLALSSMSGQIGITRYHVSAVNVSYHPDIEIARLVPAAEIFRQHLLIPIGINMRVGAAIHAHDARSWISILVLLRQSKPNAAIGPNRIGIEPITESSEVFIQHHNLVAKNVI
jgi:hypothetical protein